MAAVYMWSHWCIFKLGRSWWIWLCRAVAPFQRRSFLLAIGNLRAMRVTIQSAGPKISATRARRLHYLCNSCADWAEPVLPCRSISFCVFPMFSLVAACKNETWREKSSKSALAGCFKVTSTTWASHPPLRPQQRPYSPWCKYCQVFLSSLRCFRDVLTSQRFSHPVHFKSIVWSTHIQPQNPHPSTLFLSLRFLLPMQVGPVCIAFRLPSPMEGGQMHVIFPSMFSLPDPGGLHQQQGALMVWRKDRKVFDIVWQLQREPMKQLEILVQKVAGNQTQDVRQFDVHFQM